MLRLYRWNSASFQFGNQRRHTAGAAYATGNGFAAKLTIWKYTVKTLLAYPGSVAQLPLPIAFHVGVRPLAKKVS